VELRRAQWLSGTCKEFVMSILTMDEWIELNMEAAFVLALLTLGPYPSSSSGDRISCGVCANASCRQIRIRTTSNLARDHVAEKAISSFAYVDGRIL
jgi:hypothetical protein